MVSNLMSLGISDLLSLMDKKEISAREYAVELSEKVLSENHLNAVQSFSKDLLLKEADVGRFKIYSVRSKDFFGLKSFKTRISSLSSRSLSIWPPSSMYHFFLPWCCRRKTS